MLNVAPLTWIVVGLITTYGVVVIGALALSIRRRKTQWPFKQSDRLLRAPGEHLHRKLIRGDERLLIELFCGVAATVLAVLIVAPIVRLFTSSSIIILSAAGGTALILSCLSACRITALARQRAFDFLGWYGERMVADALAPLARLGYFLFHDVPAEGAIKDFNLDHVVVGPTGVVVVETKARRKYRRRETDKDYVVTFDGSSLTWPWGKDSRTLKQATLSASWLREWIEQRSGLKVTVRSIVAVPGWEVNETYSKAVRVVKPKHLCDAIHGHGTQVLSDDDIDKIARHLDVACRTVED